MDVVMFDSGYNIPDIKNDLEQLNVKDIYVEHILCSTLLGDQDLGFAISFTINKNYFNQLNEKYNLQGSWFFH